MFSSLAFATDSLTKPQLHRLDLNKDALEKAFEETIHANAPSLGVHFVMRNEQLVAQTTDEAFHFCAYHDWTNEPNKEDKLKQYLSC